MAAYGYYLGIYNTTTRQHGPHEMRGATLCTLFTVRPCISLHLSAPPCTSLHLSVLSIPYASSHLIGVVLFCLPLAVSLRRTHEPSKLFDDQRTPLYLRGEGALRDLSLRHLMRLREEGGGRGKGGGRECRERERERNREKCIFVR